MPVYLTLTISLKTKPHFFDKDPPLFSAPSYSVTYGRPRVGINLEEVRYYGAEVPFHNIAKQSSTWTSSSGFLFGGGLPLSSDSNGFPSGTFPFNHKAIFIFNMGSGYAPGYYNVAWLPSGANVTVDGSVINSYTFLKTTGAVHGQLIRANEAITYLSIHKSGEPTSSGIVFREPFLRRCRNYEVLRFMDWNLTNTERGAGFTWNNRITPTFYTQGQSGVALEHMIDLCNEAESDFWFCVHHQADDKYVIKAAEMCATRLNTSRTVYLEHSNETWNGGFPQYNYCLTNGPTGLDPSVRGLAYHVRRTAQIAATFKASGVPTVSVLGMQSANPGYLSYALSNGVALSGNLDAFAIAPYFGGSVAGSTLAVSGVKAHGVQWTIGECWSDMATQRDYIRSWMTNASTHGKRLLGYEGGQHLGVSAAQHSDSGLVQAFTDANRHPAMYDLYRAYLQMWYEETQNELMCIFNSCYTNSHFGNWGLAEYDGQGDAPKYRAVLDHIRGVF